MKRYYLHDYAIAQILRQLTFKAVEDEYFLLEGVKGLEVGQALGLLQLCLYILNHKHYPLALIYEYDLRNQCFEAHLIRFDEYFEFTIAFAELILLGDKIGRGFADLSVGVVDEIPAVGQLPAVDKMLVFLKNLPVGGVAELKLIPGDLPDKKFLHCKLILHGEVVVFVMEEDGASEVQHEPDYFLFHHLQLVDLQGGGHVVVHLGHKSVVLRPGGVLAEGLATLVAHLGVEYLFANLQEGGAFAEEHGADDGVGDYANGFDYIGYGVTSFYRVVLCFREQQGCLETYEIRFCGAEVVDQLRGAVAACKGVGVLGGREEDNPNVHALFEDEVYAAQGGFYAGGVAVVEDGNVI